MKTLKEKMKQKSLRKMYLME